jgi:hypothetical protein
MDLHDYIGLCRRINRLSARDDLIIL